jgi:hypothetical protein
MRPCAGNAGWPQSLKQALVDLYKTLLSLTDSLRWSGGTEHQNGYNSRFVIADASSHSLMTAVAFEEPSFTRPHIPAIVNDGFVLSRVPIRSSQV